MLKFSLTFTLPHHTLRQLLEIPLTRKFVLVIRLTRTGKTSQESFRMVVAEQSKAVKRQYVELVGHYAPTVKPKVLKFNKDRILYWISQGAQPSETVASLLKAEGVQEMDKFIHFTTDRKSRKKKAGDEPTPAPTPAPAKAETPVEAKPVEAPVEAPAETPVEATPAAEPKAEEPKTEEAPAA